MYFIGWSVLIHLIEGCSKKRSNKYFLQTKKTPQHYIHLHFCCFVYHYELSSSHSIMLYCIVDCYWYFHFEHKICWHKYIFLLTKRREKISHLGKIYLLWKLLPFLTSVPNWPSEGKIPNWYNIGKSQNILAILPELKRVVRKGSYSANFRPQGKFFSRLACP